VILRCCTDSAWNSYWAVAPYAFEFLSWANERFDCRWLTARSRDGDVEVIERAIERAMPRSMSSTWKLVVRAIPVSPWAKLKTEAIEMDGLWWWIDDAPQPDALLHLERRGRLDRWIEANTERDPDDLLRVQKALEVELDLALPS